MWERVGQKISSRYAGGVLMVEACKHVARPTGTEVRDRIPDPMRLFEGISKPARGPATSARQPGGRQNHGLVIEPVDTVT